MSQWTHVNASIRFDGVPSMNLPTESVLPCGSEGSIDYTIVGDPVENNMAAMVVVFWGDLRDYDDADEILKYFKSVTAGRMIRSGILEIDVEYKKTLVYRYDSDAEEWILSFFYKMGE